MIGVCACSGTAAIAFCQARAGQTTVITNANVITMAAGPRVQRNQTIVIRDGRFAEIVPTATAKIPPDALRIDAAGGYLAPGLTDAHVHFVQNENANLSLVKLFLANGITTVFNLYGTPMHLELRDRIRRREILGPATFTSGPSLGVPHGQTPTTTPDEIERSVVAQKQAGYDFLKLHGDLSSDAYARLMESSRIHNIPMIGHAPRNLGTDAMLRERQTAVAHFEEYIYAYLYFQRSAESVSPLPDLEEKARQIAKATKDAGTAVISTLSVYRGIAEQIEDLERVLARAEVAYIPRAVGDEWGWWSPNNTYVRRFSKDKVPWFQARYREQERLALRFQQAGVLLLAGTDTPTATMVPGFSLHDELKALVDAGLTPYEALLTATVNPASFLGRLRDTGTIEPGKIADCVLLTRNPLEQISNTRSITAVAVGGRWISSREIQRMLASARDVSAQIR